MQYCINRRHGQAISEMLWLLPTLFFFILTVVHIDDTIGLRLFTATHNYLLALRPNLDEQRDCQHRQHRSTLMALLPLQIVRSELDCPGGGREQLTLLEQSTTTSSLASATIAEFSLVKDVAAELP